MGIKLLRKAFLLFLFTGLFAMMANAQGLVRGNIRDENNNPLPGVTILVKGTSNGTTTDIDGNFSITVAENDVLVISYVGYLTEERAAKGQENFILAMVPDIVALGDVVVIGYGTIKKVTLRVL